MFKVLLVSPVPGSLATLSAALQAEPGLRVDWEKSGEAALARAADKPLDLVVVDEALKDMTAKDLINRLMMQNAAINTAVVSAMPEEEFHEAFEGLGVLAQVPPQPARAEAEGLIKRLKELAPA